MATPVLGLASAETSGYVRWVVLIDVLIVDHAVLIGRLAFDGTDAAAAAACRPAAGAIAPGRLAAISVVWTASTDRKRRPANGNHVG